MECVWLKSSPSLAKGITIINKLDDSRFEQFLRRIVSKIKLHSSEIFNVDEEQKLVKIFEIDQEGLRLAIKTFVLLFKRLLKFIFMPGDLKNDLKTIGFSNNKADFIVKVWSAETRATLDEIDSESIEKYNESLDFSWTLNAELSSNYCKKTKVPKAYLSLCRDKEDVEMEMTHSELNSLFLHLEAIQNTLDNIGI